LFALGERSCRVQERDKLHTGLRCGTHKCHVSRGRHRPQPIPAAEHGPCTHPDTRRDRESQSTIRRLIRYDGDAFQQVVGTLSEPEIETLVSEAA